MSTVRPIVCDRVRAQVSLQLDGEVSELERRLLDSHLARCAECATYSRETSEFTRLLREAPLESLHTPVVVSLPRRVALARAQIGAAAALAAAVLGATLQFTEPARERAPARSSREIPVRFETVDELQREQQLIRAHGGQQPGFTTAI